MNSMKRIAQISAIVCGIALLATIALTPFAVSSAINVYNSFVEKAETEKDQYIIETTIDSAVKSLTLSDRYYFYRTLRIEESPNNEIHILTQDNGFEKYLPNVTIIDDDATVSFYFQGDIKLSEENLLQALSFSMERYEDGTVIQIPASVSLYMDAEYMEEGYRNLDIQFKGFANYEEFIKSYDDWAASTAARDSYYDYIATIDNRLNQINEMRLNIHETTGYYSTQESFMNDAASQYNNIRNLRSDILKTNYNFRKEFSSQDEESISAAYMEMQNKVTELCTIEQEYDLLSVQQHIAEERFGNGELDGDAFSKIVDECFSQQVKLDLSITQLRQDFYDYLHEGILSEEELDIPDVDVTVPVERPAPLDTVTTAPVVLP